MINTQNFKRRWEIISKDVIEGMAGLHDKEKVVNGYYVAKVEEMLRKESKRKFALLMHSGSHAITMAIKAHGLSHNDEVIIPNYSCPATLSSVALAGVKPVFCEIDQFGMMDTSKLPDCLSENTRAILATGLYGDSHDHDGTKTFCDTNNLIYINDAAQSQFAEYNGTDSLELGDTVCMSFADNKCIPTAGTYGALLTDDEEYYETIRTLRKNGKASRLEKYASAGYSSHPEEDKAVQILASANHFRSWIERRREIGAMYEEAFKGVIETRPSPKYSRWNGHKYAVFFNDKFKAHKDLLSLGVDTEQHYPDNFSKLDWIKSNLTDTTMTDKFVQKSLTLPNNAHMTDKEVSVVIDVVTQYQKNNS